MSETFEEWYRKISHWEHSAEILANLAWNHQEENLQAEREKVEKLEARLAEAVELIDCTTDKWGKCKCRACLFLERLKELEGEG